MALFDFLSTLNSTSFILLLLVFLLFVMSMRKALSIMWNAVWIAGISVIFPIAMNKLFDFSIPTDVDSLVSFMVLGLGAYFIWLIASSVYKVLEEVEKATAKIPKPKIGLKKPHFEDSDRTQGKNMEIREREREKELEKREEELKKKEEQIRWMSKLEESKKGSKKLVKRAEEDYFELEDEKPRKKKRKDDD